MKMATTKNNINNSETVSNRLNQLHRSRQLSTTTTTTTTVSSILIALAILFINVILLTSWTLEVDGQSSCHLRELDLCATSMLVFTQAPGGLATSDGEINKQCVHLREADNCLSNYTRRCMTPIQRELVTFGANSIYGPLLDEYCTKGSRLRQNYLKHAPCLNQLQKKQEHKTCMRDLQASLELLTSNNLGDNAGGKSKDKIKDKDKDKNRRDSRVVDSQTPTSETALNGKRLQLACCTYRRFEACLGGQVEKRCGKETIQFVQSTVRRATSRMPEIVCRNFKPDGQECRALLPKLGAPPKGSKSSSIISRLLAAYTGL